MLLHVFDTAWGPAGLQWHDGGLTRFVWPGTARPADATGEPTPALLRVAAQVAQHLAGHLQTFADAPYDWTTVTPFQRAIYQAALTVRPGQTWTYGQLAAAIGQHPGVSRAVGTALGQNPWPLLVPCHRFIGAAGHMTGFSAPGGVPTKIRLLALEGAELPLE